MATDVTVIMRARVRVREGVKGWMGYRDGRVEGWRDGKGGRVEGWRDGGVEGHCLVPMTRGGQRGPPGMTPGPPKIAQNGFPGRMKRSPSQNCPKWLSGPNEKKPLNSRTCQPDRCREGGPRHGAKGKDSELKKIGSQSVWQAQGIAD